jgi:predicted nucleic acid-binding protein
VIILDTDVVSNLMSRRPSPHLLARLSEVPHDELCTTAITIGELAYGANRVNRPELYERAMRLLEGSPVLAFDQEAGQAYGRVRCDLELLGQRLSDPDLRIAATAMAQGATLVTGNVKHFGRIGGLAVADWLRG